MTPPNRSVLSFLSLYFHQKCLNLSSNSTFWWKFWRSKKYNLFLLVSHYFLKLLCEALSIKNWILTFKKKKLKKNFKINEIKQTNTRFESYFQFQFEDVVSTFDYDEWGLNKNGTQCTNILIFSIAKNPSPITLKLSYSFRAVEKFFCVHKQTVSTPPNERCSNELI